MIKKIEMRPKGTGNYSDILYPKTSADIVVCNDGDTVEQKLSSFLKNEQKGAANGVAPLGADSKISSLYIPNVTTIEPRTNDPVTPANGRIWLRTDL